MTPDPCHTPTASGRAGLPVHGGSLVLHLHSGSVMRPILLGMNNPLSPHPRHALYPHPPGCAGWRLWKMLNERTGATQEQYLATFDRRNLVRERVWSGKAAREMGREFLGHVATGSRVVVLGQQVWAALGLSPTWGMLWPLTVEMPAAGRGPVGTLVVGITVYRVPHPSGRNLWYNRADNRLAVGNLLKELMDHAQV